MIDYFADVTKTITASLASIDEAAFERVIDDCHARLRNGGKIVATGLGKNVPVCEKFVGMLTSFGIRAQFMHTNSAIHGDLGMITPDDVVFVLTKSGSTQETLILIDYLLHLKRGCKIWLLSFNGGGKLAAVLEDKLVLDLKNEGDQWDIVPCNSTSVYLILLQGIAIQLSKRLQIPISDFRENHPGGRIGEILKQGRE